MSIYKIIINIVQLFGSHTMVMPSGSMAKTVEVAVITEEDTTVAARMVVCQATQTSASATRTTTITRDTITLPPPEDRECAETVVAELGSTIVTTLTAQTTSTRD
jgi:hypothetical protein